MHNLLTAFLALGAFQVLSVTAQDPACMANCAAQVRADFTKFACANADDAGCLCANADFKNGVTDCATPCGSAAGDVETFLNDGFCLAQAPAPEAPTSEPAPEQDPAPSTEPPAPEETAAPETTSAAPETTSAAEPEKEPEPTPVPETTEELAQDTTSEPAQPETTSAPETTAAAEIESSTTLSTKTTAASNAGATSGTEEDEQDEKKEEDSDEGLSQTAIIGIGVGAGAAGLAAIGLAVWLCLRKRNKQDARPFIEISKPMPTTGAGDYTGRRDPFAEKRGDVIELQTNRYEDMLPRQVPRTVV